jgi:hypothetical protein
MHRRRLVGALGAAIVAAVIGAGPVAGTPEVGDAAPMAASSEHPQVAVGASDDSFPDRPTGPDADAEESGTNGRAVAAPGDWWPLSIVAAVVLLVAGVIVVGRIRRPV